ncbi:hypothetical protein STEG23_037131, partial [Scotinomys teguina]
RHLCFNSYINKRTGEMAQWLNSLVTLPENQGSLPRIHIVTHNQIMVKSLLLINLTEFGISYETSF